MIGSESPLQDRMIFLVGARRSGTNWLQRVVAAHPAVALVPSETYLFSRGIKPLRDRFHHGALGSPGTSFVYMNRSEMVRELRAFCDRVFLPFLGAAPGRTRLAERTPEHVTCLDVIGEIYPDAWVVHMIRDGRDVARSLVGQAWGTAPEAVGEAAEEWRSSVEAGESAGGGLGRYRAVRYEEMLADPKRSIDDLYRWLGLDTSPAMFDAALAEAETRYNVDPDAPAIRAGKWQDEFSETDLAAFMRVAGDTLIRLGYDTSGRPRGRGSGAPAQSAEPARPAVRARLSRGRLLGLGASRREQVAQLTDIQRLLNRVVEAIATRSVDDLRTLAGPRFRLSVIGRGEEWSGRGEAAWDRLAETVSSDPALEGRQVLGDVHPAFPTSTAIMSFAGADGASYLRMLAISFRNAKMVRLVYYRFGLEA